MNTPAVTSLRHQMADYNDLHPAYQEALLSVWAAYGYDAARVYCQGA
jgi:hypothetical protein